MRVAASPVTMLVRHRAVFGTAVALCLALGVTGARAQCDLTQLCAPPAGSDPCVISTNQTVPGAQPGCTLDLGSRGLVIKADTTLTVDTGLGPFSVLARSILLEPNAQIVAKGLVVQGVGTLGGLIGLVADDTITLQNLGTKHAQVAVPGSFGQLVLQAGNDITLNGSLDAHAIDSDGNGGDVMVTSQQGNLTVSGPGIRADGGNDVDNGASGGTVTLEAHGSVTIDAPIDDSDGDCGDACETDVTADTGDVTVTANGSIDVSGMGSVASGGDVQIMAAGAVQISGPILGTATGIKGEDGEGGDGGGLSISAGSNVTLAAAVSLSGAALDGDGGDVDVEAAGDILLAATGSLTVPTVGEGGGGTVFVSSSAGNATINGPVDASGDEFGGSIEVDAAGTATITSTLNADSNKPTAEGGGTGGTITIQACTISAPGGAVISSMGPGPAPDNATNLLVASGHMVLGCQLHAGTDGDDQPCTTSSRRRVSATSPSRRPSFRCPRRTCPSTPSCRAPRRHDDHDDGHEHHHRRRHDHHVHDSADDRDRRYDDHHDQRRDHDGAGNDHHRREHAADDAGAQRLHGAAAGGLRRAQLSARHAPPRSWGRCRSKCSAARRSAISSASASTGRPAPCRPRRGARRSPPTSAGRESS